MPDNNKKLKVSEAPASEKPKSLSIPELPKVEVSRDAYWVGVLPGCPLDTVSLARGCAFKETFNSENVPLIGNILYFTDAEVEAVLAHMATQAAVKNGDYVQQGAYGPGTDHLAKYVFIVKMIDGVTQASRGGKCPEPLYAAD